jgi:hypothetical protein
MALWTDLVDPATLTGYARASLADYEARKGTLAQWLPNRTVSDIVARFVAGQSGLVNVAAFRAFDAEIEIGKGQGVKRVTLDLPALGQNIPISELDQLRSRNASEDAQLRAITRTTDVVVRAVADAIERMRGIVLTTGKATISQSNFVSDDDFGRDAGHTVTLSGGALWSAPTTSDPLANLQAWSDTYTDTNGEGPGSILMSRKAFRQMSANAAFKTQLVNGASRTATEADTRAILEGAGLPPVYLYDRRVSVAGTPTKVIADDRVLLLPAAVDVNDSEGSDLGGTFWGQTLTSQAAEWEIPDADQPGIVAGVYRGEKPPMIAEVISDAIGLPVLANANLSFAAKVF